MVTRPGKRSSEEGDCTSERMEASLCGVSPLASGLRLLLPLSQRFSPSLFLSLGHLCAFLRETVDSAVCALGCPVIQTKRIGRRAGRHHCARPRGGTVGRRRWPPKQKHDTASTTATEEHSHTLTHSTSQPHTVVLPSSRRCSQVSGDDACAMDGARRMVGVLLPRSRSVVCSECDRVVLIVLSLGPPSV